MYRLLEVLLGGTAGVVPAGRTGSKCRASQLQQQGLQSGWALPPFKRRGPAGRQRSPLSRERPPCCPALLRLSPAGGASLRRGAQGDCERKVWRRHHVGCGAGRAVGVPGQQAAIRWGLWGNSLPPVPAPPPLFFTFFPTASCSHRLLHDRGQDHRQAGRDARGHHFQRQGAAEKLIDHACALMSGGYCAAAAAAATHPGSAKPPCAAVFGPGWPGSRGLPSAWCILLNA